MEFTLAKFRKRNKVPEHGFLVQGTPGKRATYKLPFMTEESKVSLPLLVSIKTILETGRLRGTPIRFHIPSTAREKAREMIAQASAHVAAMKDAGKKGYAKIKLSPLVDLPILGDAASMGSVASTTLQAPTPSTRAPPPHSGEKRKSHPGENEPPKLGPRRKKRAPLPLGKDGKRKMRIDSVGEREERLKRIQDITIGVDDLRLGLVLGKGASGEVRRGVWRKSQDEEGVDVAVKILHKATIVGEQMFFGEVSLLTRLDHPNITQIYGACLSPLMIVMEYVPHSLHGLLANGPLGPNLCLKLARGIASGMAYLHAASPPIIHRDLKPGNVLVTAEMEPRICDFGVSRGESLDSTMTVIGTPLYMAPEILRSERYTTAVDTYAFAMTFYQMLTGLPPFGYRDPESHAIKHKYNHMQLVLKVAMEHARPDIPSSIPQAFKDLLSSAWSDTVALRPTMHSICLILSQLDEPEDDHNDGSTVVMSSPSQSAHSSTLIRTAVAPDIPPTYIPTAIAAHTVSSTSPTLLATTATTATTTTTQPATEPTLDVL